MLTFFNVSILCKILAANDPRDDITAEFQLLTANWFAADAGWPRVASKAHNITHLHVLGQEVLGKPGVSAEDDGK